MSGAVFGDRLAEQVARRESQLVLGLDPDPRRLWPRAAELVGGVDLESAPPIARLAAAVAAHCRLVIDAVGEWCVAVKPQVACFEALGAPGWDALASVTAYAQQVGLLVIADAKRGDVDVSATAYARAFFGETETPFGTIASLRADALTVNPYLGSDALIPFVERARPVGAGLFVLARNSNPSAAELQDAALAGTGETVSELVAQLIARLGEDGRGESGLSDVGAVVGATAPQRIERLRQLMPSAIFLMPGVGAQGGSVEDLRAAFRPGRAAGLVSASRSIVYAFEAHGGEPDAAARHEAQDLRRQAWAVSGL